MRRDTTTSPSRTGWIRCTCPPPAFLFYVASSGGIDRFQAVRWPVNGSQGYRLQLGADSIAKKLLGKVRLRQDDVVFHQEVKRVVAREGGVDVVTADGTIFKAKRALVALSPALYGNGIAFEPELKNGRAIAARAMRTPPMVLAYVTFDKAFWRTERERYRASFPQGRVFGSDVQDIARYGLSGDVLLADGPVVWIMDATSSVDQPALFAFIVGRSVEDTVDREKAVLDEMCQLFGTDVVNDNRPKYHETNWGKEPLTGGGPTAHFGCKAGFFEHGREILLAGNSSPHEGKIYFASTESAMVSNGYMAGAAWSGQEIAADIVASLSAGNVAAPNLAREQAMRWCILRILRAIKEQEPELEDQACTGNVKFHGPGGAVLGSGPYIGKPGAYQFFGMLAQRITLTEVSIGSIAVDTEKNMGYATFTVNGVLHGIVEGDPTANGNPFRDITATMAFRFEDDNKGSVQVAEDWLFMNVEAIDAMVAAKPGPFSDLSEDETEIDRLKRQAESIAELTVSAAEIANKFMVYGPEWMVPGGQLVLPDDLQKLKDARGGAVTVTESSTLDKASMTYYGWQMVGDKRVLVSVLFKDSDEPVVSEVHFQPQRDA